MKYTVSREYKDSKAFKVRMEYTVSVRLGSRRGGHSRQGEAHSNLGVFPAHLSRLVCF